jgi:GNAT superfamily N-acetyltransferase
MISVRSAIPEDAAAWRRLRAALWPEEGPASHADEIEHYFARAAPELLEALIAVADDGTAVGFAELSIRNYAEDCATDRVAYLEGWYVAPEARRQGVGRALVVAAEAWGRAQGCVEFGSDAELDNETSRAAHLALGFEETTRLRCFRKSLALLPPRDAPTTSTALAITIRRLEPADWPAVWNIIEPVFRAGDTYAVAPDISQADARAAWVDSPSATYVAEAGGEIVGTYYLEPNQPGPGSHVCNCGYIVADRARGRGVGTALCEHSQEEARRRGFRAMQFNLVVATNRSAVRLWQTLGYEVVGTLRGAFRHAALGFVDAFVMYKQLHD